MSIVPAAGPIPSPLLFVGEAPGKQEYLRGIPFVGPSGQAQDRYLAPHGLSASRFRRTNVIPVYSPGNPDPTPSQIAHWTPYLISEISTCQPRIIVAVGRFSARWFLGESCDMDIVHGQPYRPGAFDLALSNRCPADTIIIPVYHPAWGLRSEEDPDSLAKTIIGQDYAAVARCLSQIRRGQSIQPIEDTFIGTETYEDVTGSQLADWLYSINPSVVALDTEGFPGSPWSVQISTHCGMGMTLRTAQPDLYIGIQALQHYSDLGTLFVMHQASTPSGCMYDVRICRDMGLELSQAKIFDTMYFAYLLRTESQSLKTLSSRFCGMHMEDYEGLIGDVARQKQIAYLQEILTWEWPKPEPRTIKENDGTVRTYKPNAIDRTVERILADISSGKVNKDGEPADPYKRWRKIDPVLKSMVETYIGQMPVGTLDDLPLEKSVYYSSRDSDATLRLYYRFLEMQ